MEINEKKEKLAYLATDFIINERFDDLKNLMENPDFDVNYQVETHMTWGTVSLLVYAVRFKKFVAASMLFDCKNVHIDFKNLKAEMLLVENTKDKSFRNFQNKLWMKKEMDYNFDMIIPRLIDSFESLDIDRTKNILKGIRENCICMGTGGSASSSLFASKVLGETNKIIAVSKEPRDVLFMDLFHCWNYLLGFTYGNNNYGIDEAIKYAREKKLAAHLITANSIFEDDVCYKGALPSEYSFISLASTVTPMAILLNYYLNHDKKMTLDLVSDLFFKAGNRNYNFEMDNEFPLFEIMSAEDSYVASKVLESTIIEAGLGIPVVHEKYAYCHGRSTLSYHHGKSNLIYLVNGENSNLDKKMLTELRYMYQNIIILQSPSRDRIIGEFDLSLQSLFLCKAIAEAEQKDLSRVEYAGVVKKLYPYNEGM